MNELAEKFLKKFTKQDHILGLIKQADLKVKLSCGEESIVIEIKHGNISLLNNQDPIWYEIKGDHQAMKYLMEGTEQLRVLEHKGHLTVSVPLRATLLLESLFFLTRAHENLAKVI